MYSVKWVRIKVASQHIMWDIFTSEWLVCWMHVTALSKSNWTNGPAWSDHLLLEKLMSYLLSVFSLEQQVTTNPVFWRCVLRQSYCFHFLSTWFILHILPNKQCLDQPFISPKSPVSINIRCFSWSFLCIFSSTLLSPWKVCWTCLIIFRHRLFHICIDSHQGAACITQSCFPVFGYCAAPVKQLEGCS